jgi:hypothetical protein
MFVLSICCSAPTSQPMFHASFGAKLNARADPPHAKIKHAGISKKTDFMV